MCTVTYLPLTDNDFILTSNRDEAKTRETLAPKKYVDDGVELVYPKDKLAGGTWIGTSSKKRLICVLNGAFEKHIRKTSYRKSRGVIALEILKNANAIEFVKELSLEGIEPFTLILVDWSNKLNLYELIWDEKEKQFNKLANEPKIWSSSTLYTKEIRGIRKGWFKNWLDLCNFSLEGILNFHHSEIGDKEQSILMRRSNVETVSITSVVKKKKLLEMSYEDVLKKQTEKLTINWKQTKLLQQ